MPSTPARFVRLASATLLLAAGLAGRAGAVCSEPVLLGAPIPFLTGPNAHYVATGDFNGDGVTDLAVTNGDLSSGSANSSVAILLGTGPRAFAAPALYAVGRSPRGIVARDLNADGILDLAVSNKSTHEISILIGRGTAGLGDGTFAAAVHYPTGNGPFELVAADFDRDGILDLATCLNGTGGVTVLRGLGAGGVGNGAFGPPIALTLTHLSTGIATGDFDLDGVPDLAVTQNFGGAVAILLGTGSAVLGPGSFAAPAYVPAGAPEPFHIAVADLDEDGREDLAVASTNGGGIAILRGLGDGGFAAAGLVASGNSSTVATGDVDQDGILDLVTGTVTGSTQGTVKVFLGQGSGGVGNGTFGSPSSYDPNGDVYQLLVADLDQDGAPDVLTAQGYGNYIALLPGVCAAAPVDPRAPVLTDVRDVPNDDGGRVFLTWTASSLDAPGGAVNQYRVWRRIPPALATAAALAGKEPGGILALVRPGGADAIDYWEALATLPAQRLPGYGYTAATTQDSLPHANPYTAFFVSALTANIDVFYSSNVDSGYSVDNLRPGRPTGLEAQPVASGLGLRWRANVEADLSGYRLYRGKTSDFVPSAATLVAATTDTVWVDAGGTGPWCYKLSAVDVNANESDFAALGPIGPGVPTGVGGPPVLELAIRAAGPHPSRDGRLRLLLTLPDAAPARLLIVDPAGRRAGSLSLAGRGPGSHVVTLGETRPLPSGVYVVRLIQGPRALDLKVVVTR